MSLLEIDRLQVHFPVRHGFLDRHAGVVKAVDGVSLTLDAGEALGLVGESGCGKSTLGRAIVRLVEPTGGVVRVDGEVWTGLSAGAMRQRRRRVQMVFQDPYGSLDPRMTVGEAIGEALDIHRLAADRAGRAARIAGLLESVGLRPEHAGRYPHAFSGGQRQRIGIARALAVEPRLLICDEPVSALDVSVQAQVVNLLQDLQRQRGLAYLFISHDLAVVAHLCQRVAVMYLGRIVEIGSADAVCSSPAHPYTRALLSAVPAVHPDGRLPRQKLSGDAPTPLNPPEGCPFHPRCPLAEARCRSEVPRLVQQADGRAVACHLVTGGAGTRP
jgi:oligopeptide/dipeptide ABC transporter ATP-binding protein